MVGNDLPKCEANYAPLTPLTFIQRTAAIYPQKASVVYGERHFTWSQTLERCRRLASALRSHSISAGDTVAVVAPNVPAMYECHFGVPMAGAVLNTLNIRLDVRSMARILGHSEAKLVFVDTDFLTTVQEALQFLSDINPTACKPLLVHIEDEASEKVAEVRAGRMGKLLEFEDFLRMGDPTYPMCWPEDEWNTISVNYTSGTTSHPKGVVYHHRGAYINALVTALEWQMPTCPVYLWTLPMFHCNGWCFPWTVAAQAGTNICLRSVTPKAVFDAIADYRVTHMCGAPVILNMIASAMEHEQRPISHKVAMITGGAPPPAQILATMESLGFSVTHSYGLTESYGPATWCVWKDEWNLLNLDERAKLKARQGVAHMGLSHADVLDPLTMTPVPRDGQTMGEVMMKGNTIMKGYLKDSKQTEEAFRGGWFHTGDLGVMHPDNFIALKDRSKDIIISGGENISSIEVESILFRHPQILDVAVVARPDKFWGETPCAFVTLRDPSILNLGSGGVTEESIIEYCRTHMPRFMIPRTVVFGDLPKTVTGKVQKNVLRERAKQLGAKVEQTPSKL